MSSSSLSLRTILAVLAALLLRPSDTSAQQYDTGIFEMAVTGLDRATVRVLVDSTGRVLAPLTELLLITGIPGTRSGDIFRFEWPPPSFSSSFDAATGVVSRDNAVVTLAPQSWTRAEQQVYVDSIAIDALFGATMRTSSTDLVLLLSQEGGFPAERRLEQELRREARLRLAQEGVGFDDVAYPALSGIGALNWDASAVLAEGTTHAVLRGVAGAAVFGGSLELAGSLGLGVDLRGNDVGSRFVRPFPNSRYVQQITIGSVSSPTPIPRFIVGAHISNTPYIRPNDFQEIAYQPTLPPGWTAEVYEGETLIGVIGGEDREIDVPVGYGYTPLRVRLLGPAGQERNEQLQYIVPAARLPSQRLEYNFGIGECRTTTCEHYAFADITRGISSWATAGIGVDHVRRATGRRSGIYSILSVNPKPNLSFETQTAGTTHARAVVQYLGARNTSLSSSIAWYDPNDPDLVLAGIYFDVAAALHVGSQAVSTSSQLRFEDGRITEARVFTGMPVRFGFIGAQWNRADLQDDLFSARVFLTPSRRAWLPRDFTLGATTSFNSNRLEVVEINTSMTLHRQGTLNSLFQWDPHGGPPALSLTYSFRTSSFAGQSRVFADRDNPSIVLGLNGGIAASPRGHFHSQPLAAVGRAGIRGTTFLDTNGNGMRDNGEQTVAAVPVIIDAQRAVSDSAGRFQLWDAPAVRGTAIVIDSLGLRDARLMPARPFFPVRLVANTWTTFDIPLIRTREISGAIQAPAGTTIGGIAVVLTRTDGRDVLQTRTFSDGEFYFPRVPPGDYTLSVATSSLDALGMAAAPASRTIRVPFTPGPPLRTEPISLISR